jgi:S-adenosyl-L-methionine hydrolase (adenosine-forming)
VRFPANSQPANRLRTERCLHGHHEGRRALTRSERSTRRRHTQGAARPDCLRCISVGVGVALFPCRQRPSRRRGSGRWHLQASHCPRGRGSPLVGPDNGLLSGAFQAALRRRRRPGESYRPKRLVLPSDVKGVIIEPGDRTDVSATFEGRHVFAPAAGHLASGGRLSELGPAVSDLAALPAFRAPRSEDGVLQGVVLHIDHFGNAITDIAGSDLPSLCLVEVAGRRLELRRTYAEADGVCAIVSSTGRVEIAMPNSNAARELSMVPGMEVTVRPVDRSH